MPPRLPLALPHAELPTVLRNDEVDWPTLQQRIAAGEFHNIVISPGPGTPERPGDIGVSLQLLQAQLPIPILGVCLGFQALALAHGGSVRHAPEPVHGRLSSVQHGGHPLFAGIPSGPAYAVVRYHSLLVEEASLPGCLQGIAWTCGEHHALQLGEEGAADAAAAAAHAAGAAAEGGAADAAEAAVEAGGSAANGQGASQPRRPPTGADGGQRLLMALAHRSLPHYGVQFHPESVATGYGIALLRNFAALTWQHCGLSVPAMPPSLLAKLAGEDSLAHRMVMRCMLWIAASGMERSAVACALSLLIVCLCCRPARQRHAATALGSAAAAAGQPAGALPAAARPASSRRRLRGALLAPVWPQQWRRRPRQRCPRHLLAGQRHF
jgi:para-aminobenzoate synthetase